MKKIGLFLLSVVLMTSCATTANTVKYTVASEKASCVGVGPQECLQVKKGNDTKWSFFYSSIEGFTHESGYEYVLEVKEDKLENVPADAPSIKYTLVKEVSKTKKTSENMLQAAPISTSYSWTGKVISVEGNDVGKGAAEGKFPVTVVKLQVTSISDNVSFKEGDVIHCELIAEPKVKPEVGREYAFKAKVSHPAHALGVYMLDTDVLDLTR